MNSTIRAIIGILGVGSISALNAVAIAGCSSEASPATRTPGAVTISWADDGVHSTTVTRADCLRTSVEGVILVETRDLIRRPDGLFGVGVDLRGEPTLLVMRPETGQDTRDTVPSAAVTFTQEDRSAGSMTVSDVAGLLDVVSWQCPS